MFSFAHIGRDSAPMLLPIAPLISWIITLDRWIVLARGGRADRQFHRYAPDAPSPLAAFAELLARRPACQGARDRHGGGDLLR